MAALAQWIGAQAADALSYLCAYFGEVCAFGRGDEYHVETLFFKANLPQKFFYIRHAALRSQITFQVMAGSLQSASDEDAIHASLESTEQVDDIYFAAAGQMDDFDVGWVLDSHRACQVGSGIGTVVASKSENLRFKLGHRIPLTPPPGALRLSQGLVHPCSASVEWRQRDILQHTTRIPGTQPLLFRLRPEWRQLRSGRD